MNSQRSSLLKLSTNDLIQIIIKSEYADLANTIRQFKITGKDLLELNELKVIREYGNKINRKLFMALINCAQTTPQKLIPANYKSTPSSTIVQTSESNVSSELNARLMKQRQRLAQNSNDSGLSESLKIETNKVLSHSYQQEKPILSAKPSSTLQRTAQNQSFGRGPVAIPNWKPTIVKHDLQKPFIQNSRNIANAILPRQVHQPQQSSSIVKTINNNKHNLPISKSTNGRHIDQNLQFDNNQANGLIKKQIQTKLKDDFEYNDPGSPHFLRGSSSTSSARLTWKATEVRHDIVNQKPTSPAEQTPSKPTHSPLFSTDQTINNDNFGRDPYELSTPNLSNQQNHDQVPTYNCQPNILAQNQDWDSEDEFEIPEYINSDTLKETDEHNETEEQNHPLHFLQDPVTRSQFNEKLKLAYEEMCSQHGKTVNEIDLPEYGNIATIYDGGTETPELLDCFDRTEASTPNESLIEVNEPPELPERPPDIFKPKLQPGVIKTVKVRNSSDIDKTTSTHNSGPTATQPSSSRVEYPSSAGIYEAHPVIQLVQPVIPQDVPPDNNEYEHPVTLNSPQYVLRRVKFFREVTRDDGMAILANKPPGTFLLRPSKAHLAVLMFIGVSRICHVPICHDDFTNEFYLASSPGTNNPHRFKNMLDLLEYYSEYPASGYDKLLHHSENNIGKI